ncbi:MAG: PAS domain S-box protein [Candidatus Kapaibacterium sp.]
MAKKKTKKKIRLEDIRKYRWSALFTFIMTIVIAFLLYVLYMYVRHYDEEAFVNSKTDIVKMLSNIVAPLTEEQADQSEFNKLLYNYLDTYSKQNINSTDDIISIYIRTNDQYAFSEQLFHYSNPSYPLNLQLYKIDEKNKGLQREDHLFASITPIYGALGNEVGTITVLFSTDSMEEKASSFINLVMLLATFALLLFMLIVFLLPKLILNPVNSIVKTMQLVQAGNYSARIELDKNGTNRIKSAYEFDFAVEVFNDIASVLETKHRELSSLNNKFYNDVNQQMELFSKEIAKAKKSEENISKEIQAINNIIEYAPFPIIELSSDFIIIRNNNMFSKIFGYENNELIGRNIRTILYDYNTQELQEIFEKSINSTEVYNIKKIKGRKKTGKLMDLEIKLVFISNDIKGRNGFILTINDISETLSMSKKIRENESRYRNLIEGTVTGYIIIQDNFITFANDATLRILGYPSFEDLYVTPLENIINPEDREAFFKKTSTEENEATNLEIEVTCFAGETKTIEGILTTVTIDNIQRKQLSFYDITKRKSTEQKLMNMNEILEQRILERTKSLNNAMQLLRSEIDKKEEIASSLQIKSNILDIIQTVCIVHDQDGKCVYFNKYLETLLGDPKNYHKSIFDPNTNPIELEGIEYEILSDEIFYITQENIAKVAKGEIPLPNADKGYWILKIRNKFTDNETYYYQMQGIVKDGMFIQTGIDITNMVVTNENLKIAKEQIEFQANIIDQISAICFLFNAHTGECTYATPYTANLLGTTSKELLGQGIWKYLDNNPEIKKIRNLINSPDLTTETDLFSNTIFYMHQADKYFNLYIEFLENNNIICFGSDITERILAQNEIEQKNKTLEQLANDLEEKYNILNNSLSLSLVFDETGDVVYYNPYVLEAFALSEQYRPFWPSEIYEMYGKMFEIITENDKFKFTKETMSKIVKGEIPIEKDNWIIKVCHEGTNFKPKYFKTQGVVLDNKFIQTSIDVTDIVLANEKLKKITEELKLKSHILDNIPVTCIVADTNGDYIYHNPYTIEAFAIPAITSTPSSYFENQVFEDIDKRYETFHELGVIPPTKENLAKIAKGEISLMTSEGKMNWLMKVRHEGTNNETKYFKTEGVIIDGLFIQTGIDITSEILTNEKLQKTTEELKLKSHILDNIPVTCLVSDINGDYIYYSPYSIKAFAIPAITSTPSSYFADEIFKDIDKRYEVIDELNNVIPPTKENLAKIAKGEIQLRISAAGKMNWLTKICHEGTNYEPKYFKTEGTIVDELFIQTGIDITREILANEKLEKLTGQLQLQSDILDQIPAICIVMNSRTGGFIYTNSYTLSIIDISKEELEEYNIFDVSNSRNLLELFVENTGLATQTNETITREKLKQNVILEHPITKQYFRINSDLLQNGDIISVGIDITEQVLAQKEIKDKNTELENMTQDLIVKSNMLDSLGSLCLVYDKNGECIYCNSYTLESFSITDDQKYLLNDINNINLHHSENVKYEVVSKSELRFTQENIKKVLNNEITIKTIEQENYILKISNHKINYDTNYFKLHSTIKDNLFIQSGTDITDLVLSNNKLEELTKQLEDALIEEQELNELKTRFVSMISHEYRTPLTIILSSVAVIQQAIENNRADMATKFIERIEKAVKTMSNLMEDVLAFGKAEATEVTNIEEINLTTFISDMILSLDSVYKQYTSKVKLEVIGEIPIIKTNEKLLTHIIQNLLTNAIKYTTNSEDAIIKIVKENENIRIDVIDKGIGIPEEDLKHLFQDFYRATNVGNIQGTGLGMRIVKDSVNKLGGKITVESKVNVGSTFTVVLPINTPPPAKYRK